MDKKNTMNYPYFKRQLLFFISVFFLWLISLSPVFAQDGESIFKANCTACHAIKDKVVGPALKGVSQRHKDEWLLKWVKNSQAMVKAGDPDAVKLFTEYKTVMTSFGNLKDDEIKSIFAYIKTEEAKPDATAGPVTGVPGAP